MDIKKTIILLIGVSEYPEDSAISSIPNIKINISELEKTFTNPEILGIERENIIFSLNESKINIERKLITASRLAKNQSFTLLVYYSGHGIISSEDFRLYLTTLHSTLDFLESDSIPIDTFRKVLTRSRAGRKIVILDACHSGQIHNAMNNLSSQLSAELKKFEGSYIITSASEDEPSLFPVDKPNEPTYFTAKFLEILQNGLNNGKPHCTLSEIFNEMVAYFRSKNGFPVPQQSSFQNIDEMNFVKNRFIEKYKIFQKTRIPIPSYADIPENKEIITLTEVLQQQRRRLICRHLILVSLVGVSLFFARYLRVSHFENVVLTGNKAQEHQLFANFSEFSKEKKKIFNISNAKNVENLISEGDKWFLRGENFYSQAKKCYLEAQKLNSQNSVAQEKLTFINSKIDEKFFEYKKQAETFLKADNSCDETRFYLLKALSLKPDDVSVRQLLESLPDSAKNRSRSLVFK